MLRFRFATGLLAIGLVSSASTFAEPVDVDHLAFLQAQGEASWISANADHPLANSAYRPIPSLADFPTDTAKRDLGFALFHDTSLSRDSTVACNTCHMGMMGGTDGMDLARGINGERGPRNTPTVFNAAFNFRQFWDGRAFDLDAQSLEPITNPVEMGHDLNAVVATLKADARYAAMFAQAYPDGVTTANLGNAISQHTKDMTRTDSPFNDYLNDESKVLPTQAMRGKERFNALGCVSCHNGINLGGNSYQPIASSFSTALQYALPGEEGLAARSGREEDRLVFKVPQLHNVAMTAPYYHDGSVATLPDAIRRMGAQQVGRALSDQDVDDIGAFLTSLNSAFFNSRTHNMNDSQLQDAVRQQMPDAMGQGHRMHGEQHMQHMQHSPQTKARVAMPVIEQTQGNNSHHSDYFAALNNVTQGEARIAAAMQHVQSGQVAHYDFLQNEHIELIRHARALAWPPSNISAPNKDTLRKDAQTLLSSAESLEWIIADYLRAVAQVRSATSNTLDIAKQASQGAETPLQAKLETLQIDTLMFMTSAYQDDWETLSQAYDSVFASDISEQTRRELTFQKERLVMFTEQLQTHMQALLESDVDVKAAALKALYEAAI